MQKTISTNVLLVLLFIQAIFSAVFVVYAWTDFSGMLDQFGVQYRSDMNVLQFIIIYNAFISLSICAWSISWIRKNNLAGIQTGITLGALLFILSLAIFIRFDRVDILLIDTIRAALMVIFGLRAYNEHKENHRDHSLEH